MKRTETKTSRSGIAVAAITLSAFFAGNAMAKDTARFVVAE